MGDGISSSHDVGSKKDEKKDEEDEENDDDEEEEEGMDMLEFERLFKRIGIEDQSLIKKIFWIFDEDGSGDVDHKEIAIGLEMMNNTTYEEKIGKFFDLCDDDGSGSINKKEFYSLLKLNLNDYEDIKKLKTYVKEIFRDFDVEGDGELGKEEMINACTKNHKIKNLIE
jgi:Ca2+-binding EF-hand superfamily protein